MRISRVRLGSPIENLNGLLRTDTSMTYNWGMGTGIWRRDKARIDRHVYHTSTLSIPTPYPKDVYPESFLSCTITRTKTTFHALHPELTLSSSSRGLHLYRLPCPCSHWVLVMPQYYLSPMRTSPVTTGPAYAHISPHSPAIPDCSGAVDSSPSRFRPTN